MNLHEYQSKQLLENFDLPTAKSVVAFSEEEISSLISELDGEEFVVKVQVHAGGRGKAGGVKITNDIDEIILIGGAKVFAEGLKQTTKLVISWVDASSIKGDVYFPEFNKQEWREVDSKKFFKSEKNQYDFEIKEYLRK